MHFPDILFSAATDRALGWMVVHSIWQATAIALLSGVLLVVLRQQTAHLRYRVAGIAMMTVLFMALVTFYYYYNDHSTDGSVSAMVVANSGEIASRASFQGTIRTEIPSNPIAGSVTGGTEPVSIETFRGYFDEHLPLIAAIWILGMAAFLLRLLGGLSYVYYLRGRMNFPVDPYWTEIMERMVEKTGLRKSIPVLESALTRSPLTIGHLKPLILFPIGIINRLSESEVEAILAHELAHILRRDYLFNILQSIVEALFYYHPAVWWLSNQLRNERESACDEKAIELCGDKINYAKALVTMQEMAFYPMTPALAFAGQRQSQFLKRMQRLFQQPHTQFNIMEKWIATSLVICSILALTFGQQLQDNTPAPTTRPQLSLTSADESFRSGIWEAEISKDSLCISFSARSGKHGNWMHSECFPQSAFSGMPLAIGEVRFTLTRPAGLMTFTGKMEDANGAYGRFSFAASEDFRANLKKEGIAEVDDELMAHCFLGNLSMDYVPMMRRYGYDNLTKDDLQELAIFRLNEPAVKEYQALLAELGESKPTLRDLIEYSIHDIDRAYVRSLKSAGYTKLSAEKIKEFKIHGVTAEYIRDMTRKNDNTPPSPDELLESKIHGLEKIDLAKLEKAGYKNLSHEDVLSLAIHGIDEDYIKEVSALGLGKLDVEELVSTKIHGITPAFVQSYKAMNLGEVNTENLIQIKIHDITPEFVQSFKTMNLGEVNTENLIQVKIHSITPEFVQSFKAMKIGEVDIDNLMQAKIHGITPEFVQSFKAMNIGEANTDNLMQAKIHGITPEFVQSFKAMKVGEANIDNLMQAKIHGITPDFVQSFKSMKIGEVDIDNLMQAKIHGITPEFVQSFKTMNIGEANIDNLMQAKIHGLSPEFVEGFRNMGFKNLEVDDLVSAKIHKVTPAFIKEANDKGYRFPHLGGYADLKVRMDWLEKSRSH